LKGLLLIGPSYRRNKTPGLLPAIERYDGVFYMVARKYLTEMSNIDVLVMKDDFSLISGHAPLLYTPPEGENWRKRIIKKEILEEARKKNYAILRKNIDNGKYSEVFIAMGKTHAESLPDFSQFNIKIVFPTSRGLGSKAHALKNWLLGKG